MDTKLKGDIAEQVALLAAMKLGWGVLRPLGDRLPYDMVFDVQGKLARIQVKHAWLDRHKQNYVVDTRRTQTNRRYIKRSSYQKQEFDFALAYIDDIDVFYVFPSQVFCRYGSEIHMVESTKRQRKPQSAKFRDAWHLILQWAAQDESLV